LSDNSPARRRIAEPPSDRGDVSAADQREHCNCPELSTTTQVIDPHWQCRMMTGALLVPRLTPSEQVHSWGFGLGWAIAGDDGINVAASSANPASPDSTAMEGIDEGSFTMNDS